MTNFKRPLLLVLSLLALFAAWELFDRLEPGPGANGAQGPSLDVGEAGASPELARPEWRTGRIPAESNGLRSSGWLVRDSRTGASLAGATVRTCGLGPREHAVFAFCPGYSTKAQRWEPGDPRVVDLDAHASIDLSEAQSTAVAERSVLLDIQVGVESKGLLVWHEMNGDWWGAARSAYSSAAAARNEEQLKRCFNSIEAGRLLDVPELSVQVALPHRVSRLPPSRYRLNVRGLGEHWIVAESATFARTGPKGAIESSPEVMSYDRALFEFALAAGDSKSVELTREEGATVIGRLDFQARVLDRVNVVLRHVATASGERRADVEQSSNQVVDAFEFRHVLSGVKSLTATLTSGDETVFCVHGIEGLRPGDVYDAGVLRPGPGRVTVDCRLVDEEGQLLALEALEEPLRGIEVGVMSVSRAVTPLMRAAVYPGSSVRHDYLGLPQGALRFTFSPPRLLEGWIYAKRGPERRSVHVSGDGATQVLSVELEVIRARDDAPILRLAVPAAYSGWALDSAHGALHGESVGGTVNVYTDLLDSEGFAYLQAPRSGASDVIAALQFRNGEDVHWLYFESHFAGGEGQDQGEDLHPMPVLSTTLVLPPGLAKEGEAVVGGHARRLLLRGEQAGYWTYLGLDVIFDREDGRASRDLQLPAGWQILLESGSGACTWIVQTGGGRIEGTQ
jgi:hypothetical protein